MKVEKMAPPATPELIAEVEQGLSVAFPNWLREIYLTCDGFTGPTGVRYVWPLNGDQGVLRCNHFLREDWQCDWLRRAIIFSDNGLGGSITVHWGALDGRLIEWCYGDADEYKILDLSLFDLWAREQAIWDDVLKRAT
ncbi:MAG TPA: SMI1/KNR4 family protein [Phycisphaerae bacterium]|nr:SMI1/KNR4 family protein [Phycisphaerae bacterium]